MGEHWASDNDELSISLLPKAAPVSLAKARDPKVRSLSHDRSL